MGVSERLDQPFVIENRPGNVTNIATEAVVRAPAAGYALLLAYFAGRDQDDMHAAFQAQQAKALLLRRNGRIHFQGDSSTMILPGEITLARRPL